MKAMALTSLVALGACAPGEMEAPFRVRHERFPLELVDFRGPQRVKVSRLQEAGERLPVEGEVTAWLLDSGNVRQEATVTVRIATTSVAEVEFTPRSKAPLELYVNWGAKVGTSVREVKVVELLDGLSDTQVTYPDRMDRCSTGVWRLPSGRVACERAGQVQLYASDGSPESALTGFDLVVTGGELWLGVNGGLEHRTELEDGGLRFDGVATFPVEYPVGETRAGRAVRGTTGGVVEVTWDGGSLATRVLDGYPDLGQVTQTVLLDDDVLTTGRNLCRVMRGCATTSCPPVFTCFGANAQAGDAHAVTATDVWSMTGCDGACALFLRRRDRLDVSRARLEFPGATFDFGRLAPVMAMSQRFALRAGDGSALPVADAQEAWFQIWRHQGPLVGASDDWLIAAPGPYTLRFHRVEATP